MDYLQIEGLRKAFGREIAVDGVSFGVEKGKILTLLGPSGCGKTTTLRCIAGLEHPDAGSIVIDGETMTGRDIFVPPERRHVGMVFQSYAVWPHMTVFQNVSYPLQVRKWTSGKIAGRVDEVLDMVGLSRYRDQYATKLSGGQQQRVALARALVFNPRLLLFDEPLSNLDAKLREQLRVELVRVQREVGITSVYVTHDQAEAMVISDQIIVMNRGRIEQQGDARTIYTRPASRFVAEFVGLANLLPARIIGPAGPDGSLSAEAMLEGKPQMRVLPAGSALAGDFAKDRRVLILFRPEDIEIGAAGAPRGDNCLEGRIVSAVYMGSCVDYHVDVGGLRVRAQARPRAPWREGDRVALSIGLTACLCIPEAPRAQ
jgi:iron(III) transport system ATP-binding protein